MKTLKMKKVIFSILLILFPINILAWDKLINAIAVVESNNNPKAVNGDQVGVLQIRPILVKECNRILQKKNISKRYTLADRRSVIKSKEMFIIYQRYYNPKKNVEHGIRLWNGGPNYTKKGTQEYYLKVKERIKR